MRRISKLLILALLPTLLLSLAGCTKKTFTTTVGQNNNGNESPEISILPPFPKDPKITEQTEIKLTTSQGIGPAVATLNKNTFEIQPNLILKNFNKQHKIYLYINKQFYKQIPPLVGAEEYNGPISIPVNLLVLGTNSISAVQFDYDDPFNGKVTAFNEFAFEVRGDK